MHVQTKNTIFAVTLPFFNIIKVAKVEDRKSGRCNSGVYCCVSIVSLLQQLNKNHSHEIALKQHSRKYGQYLRFNKKKKWNVNLRALPGKKIVSARNKDHRQWRKIFYSFQFRFILL